MRTRKCRPMSLTSLWSMSLKSPRLEGRCRLECLKERNGDHDFCRDLRRSSAFSSSMVVSGLGVDFLKIPTNTIPDFSE
jgi:hypothetical protein